MESSTGDSRPPARRTRNPRGGGDALRMELINAAAAMVDVRGEEAMSMRAVTKAVGVAPQSIYLHFTDMEELLWAVLRRRFGELLEVNDEAASTAGADPKTQLRARCLSLCSYGLSHPRRYQLLMNRAAPTKHDIAMDELPGAAMFRALQTAVEHLSKSPRTGDFDSFALTTDLLATLHGGILLRSNMPSFPWPSIEDLADRAIAALCRQL